MNLVELFCHVDDFCPAFEAPWIRHQLTTGRRQRRRAGQLCLSEIMTLLIWFHPSQYRHFKACYQQQVCRHLGGAFPRLVRDGRLVELMPSALMPLCAYLRQCQGACTGIFVYRLDAVGRMSSPSSAPAPTLCRAGARGQTFDRLVFWLQAASGRQ